MYKSDVNAFLAFARAPLIWSAAILAVYAPFAFVDAVIQPPPPDCTDWLWCDSRYVGLVFTPTPAPENLWALVIIPGAFLAFLAARIAARGPNRSAHWFMAPTMLVLFGLSLYFFFQPFSFFIDASASYRPAVIVRSQQLAFALAIMASVPIGLLELIGAWIWRLTRSRAIAAATS